MPQDVVWEVVGWTGSVLLVVSLLGMAWGVEHGYAATTVAAVAEAAGVSTQTVFGTFGGKAGLLSEAIDVALAGDDESADEATVKRFFREDGGVRLQPENDALAPIYARHVQILGKVVGVFRML